MISVILTSFNRKHLLVKSLQSILEQTYKEIEVIIIDNNSTDGTSGEIEKFKDERIKFYNVGNVNNLGKSRNIGIQSSAGELIAFCDDDDIWYPDKLSEQLKFIDETGVVCTDVNFVDVNNKIISRSVFKDTTSNLLLDKSALLYQNVIMVTSVLLKREILYKADLFNPLKYCEDFDLWMKVTDFTNIFFLNKILMSVTILPNSLSRTIDNAIEMRNIIISHQLKYVNDNDPKLRLAARAGLIKKKIELAKLKLSKRDFFSFSRDFLSLAGLFFDFKVIKFFLQKFTGKQDLLIKKMQ